MATTWHLDRSDARKFSLCNPSEITRAMERIWDPSDGTSPTPSRILQDVRRIPHACFQIVSHMGKIVPGLANRNGHRRPKGTRENSAKQHYDKTLEELGLHHSIRSIVKEQVEKDRQKFDSQVKDGAVLTQASIAETSVEQISGECDV